MIFYSHVSPPLFSFHIFSVKVCKQEIDAILDSMVDEEGWCATYKGVQVCNNDVQTEGVCVSYKGATICKNEAEEEEEQGLKKIVKKVGKAVRKADINIDVGSQSIEEQDWTISGCITVKGMFISFLFRLIRSTHLFTHLL